MAITQHKDGRWIVYYRIKTEAGKSRVKKEYFGRGATAAAKAKKRNGQLMLKKRRPVKERIGPTVGELAADYSQYKNFSANSAKQLTIRLTANLLPFFGHRAAIELTDADLDRYCKQRRAAAVYDRGGKIMRHGVTASTIARELTDLQAILNWSVRRRPPLIRFNPVGDYKKPKQDNAIIAPPTADETTAILKAASPHIVRCITFSYYLGLRPGNVELLQIVWADVNFDAATVLVRSAHKGGPLQRHVAIHDDFLPQLKRWFDQDNGRGPVIRYHGRAIKKIGKAWAGTLARAGITRRIRPYDMRHGFITTALEAGADIGALSQVVGSSPETLRRHYQHVSQKLHRETIAKIPALGTN